MRSFVLRYEDALSGGVFLVGGGGVVLSNDRLFNTWYTKETHSLNPISCTFCLQAKRAADATWLKLLQKVVTARQIFCGWDVVKSFKPRSMPPAHLPSFSSSSHSFAVRVLCGQPCFRRYCPYITEARSV